MTENDYQILLAKIEPLAGEWLDDNPLVTDEAVVVLLAQALQESLSMTQDTAIVAETIQHHTTRHLRQMFTTISKEEAQRGTSLILSMAAILIFSLEDYSFTDLANELFFRAANIGGENYLRNKNKIMAMLQANDDEAHALMLRVRQDLPLLGQLPEGRSVNSNAGGNTQNSKYNLVIQQGSNPIIMTEPQINKQN